MRGWELRVLVGTLVHSPDVILPAGVIYRDIPPL